MSDDEPSTLTDFELVLVTLNGLSLNRWGTLSAPGAFNWQTGIEISEGEDWLSFRIHNRVEIADRDTDDEESPNDGASPMSGDPDSGSDEESSDTEAEDEDLDARITVVHLVVFQRPEREITAEERVDLSNLARLAVHPLAREKVLTLTADMGMPPLVLPLLHASSMPELDSSFIFDD